MGQTPQIKSVFPAYRFHDGRAVLLIHRCVRVFPPIRPVLLAKLSGGQTSQLRQSVIQRAPRPLAEGTTANQKHQRAYHCDQGARQPLSFSQ